VTPGPAPPLCVPPPLRAHPRGGGRSLEPLMQSMLELNFDVGNQELLGKITRGGRRCLRGPSPPSVPPGEDRP